MTGGLIGGIGITHLKVYDQRPGPDGVTAGCAHIHALTDEAYYGYKGSGAVELHDPDGGFRTVPITPGTYVEFPPGTLHRSVCYDDFEVVAIMGNSGLPERGDARIYFGPEIDADPVEFERLKGLTASGLDGALERRDASAEGYARLCALWETDQDAYRAELVRFMDVHRASLVAKKAEMEAVLREGPMARAEESLRRLADLPSGARQSSARHGVAGETGVVYGMCGILRQVSSLKEIGN